LVPADADAAPAGAPKQVQTGGAGLI